MTPRDWILLATLGALLAAGVWYVWRVVRREVTYYEGLIRANFQILATNKLAHARAELALFSWKEHGLWMHDVARDTLTVLSQLEPTNPAELESFHRVVAALTEQLHIIDGDFVHTFRCSPEQWRARRAFERPLFVSTRTGKPVDRETDLGVN